jgi:glycosyltransferase involved in cell wall biosynthesis
MVVDSRQVVFLIPVYNDWEAVGMLLGQLDQAVGGVGQPLSVVLIDDGSTDPVPGKLRLLKLSHLQFVDILTLRRNLGHQRALAVGLCHVQAAISCRAVLIMDGDGEDSPEDAPRLLAKLDEAHDRQIVFAERTRRSESWLFCICYHLYRILHLALTGIPVRVGNFSVVPAALLDRLVAVSALWNHYAAAVYVSHLPFTTIPTRRATRLAAGSRMNFVSLVTHGLSAIAVFGERVGVRLLLILGIVMGMCVVGLVVIVLLRLTTNLAIPGWATYTSGILVLMLFQLLVLLLSFVFMILQGRDQTRLLPFRDCLQFIEGSRRLVSREDG